MTCILFLSVMSLPKSDLNVNCYIYDDQGSVDLNSFLVAKDLVTPNMDKYW